MTAVNAAAVRCQAQRWGPSGTSELVAVRCFAAGGAPAFSPFTVLFNTWPGAPGSGMDVQRRRPAAGLVAQVWDAGNHRLIHKGEAPLVGNGCLLLRVTRHECRTSPLMNTHRSYEAGRNSSAMATVTLSCSP